MTDTPKTETRAFAAEAKQLLDLVIHALYSHKDVFLRELISNASDAIDRLRFEALTQPELLGVDEKPCIRLETDKKARTLTIHDDGIGMSREELVTNIGTIARSGTRELLQSLKAKGGTQSPELIGQFGVGFYSAFIAADKVTLTTRRAGESSATRWESDGAGEYTVSETERDTRGTSITLHLKAVDQEDGLEDFTDEWVLKRIVTAYSDFVTHPIYHHNVGSDPAKSKDEPLNSMKAIWTRPASEVSDSEYEEFYKHLSHDWQAPLRRITLAAEGTFEYRALVFVPSKAPFDMLYADAKTGLQLYVKRVRIEEHCEHLVPRYLRFLKGVVDAPDLTLNVSREMLQHDRRIAQIRKRLTKKVLESFEEMRDKEPALYLKFWNELGRALKEGVAVDAENRERLQSLLLFPSSHHESDLTSFQGYVERMKEGQTEIYYLTGPSRAVVEKSPHLESLRAQGYEVLYLVDPIDELVVENVDEVSGKKLRSAGKGDIKTGTEEEKKAAEEKREEKSRQHASLLELIQKKLEAQVKEVRLTSRLSSSPACLVGEESDLSPHMERLLRHTQGIPKQKRILELNPDHPILAKMQERFDKDRDDATLGEWSELLYGQAVLAEGSELEDPARFSKLVADLMMKV